MAKHSVNPQLMADAKALLEGEMTRQVRRPNLDCSRRVKAFAATSRPEMSREDLAKAFPDRADYDADDPYCKQSPLERAISEVICDVVDCETSGLSHSTVRYEEIVNPLYLHEIRLAQRRTMEQLLKMAEEPEEEECPPSPPVAHEREEDLHSHIHSHILAAESLLAGLNPPKSTGWTLPGACHGRVREFFDLQSSPFEFRWLAQLRAEDGLSPEEVIAAEGDDDTGFEESPTLRRKAIAKALSEVLSIISENFTHDTWPENVFLAHSLRMAYRKALIELLAIWYQEERGTKWALRH